MGSPSLLLHFLFVFVIANILESYTTCYLLTLILIHPTFFHGLNLVDLNANSYHCSVSAETAKASTSELGKPPAAVVHALPNAKVKRARATKRPNPTRPIRRAKRRMSYRMKYRRTNYGMTVDKETIIITRMWWSHRDCSRKKNRLLFLP
jgi:hypothetical protein